MGANPEDHLDGCELDFKAEPETKAEELPKLLIPEDDVEDEDDD